MQKAVVIGIVTVFALFFATICYVQFMNHDKPHVYSAKEVYVIECSKRGGNPVVSDGRDYSGDKDVDIQDYKCEGESDVHN